MPTALVTGGGTGLGAAFARELAGRGHDLVLVARDRVRLERAAAAHRASGVAVEVIAADLTRPADLARVERRLADRTRPIDALVNNAGISLSGEFPAAQRTALQAEIDLNVTAVLRLTHAAVPAMTERGHGTVINVASFAGYLPACGSAYGASKSWVLAFTDTVSASLTGTGVQAIAVAAGRLRTERHLGPARRSPLWLDPADVVRRCLADLEKGRTLSTPGVLYRAVVDVLEAPRRTLRAAARAAGRDRLAQRRASRASAGATSSITITRRTCTATTNVMSPPAEIAVASTA